MTKYEFPVKEQTAKTGGYVLEVRNHQADVDETNEAVMSLVKLLKGEKMPNKSKAKRGKK